MALTGKIFKEEKDILYIRGQIKAEEKALQEKRQSEMLADGFPIGQIIKYTKLSKEEIQTL